MLQAVLGLIKTHRDKHWLPLILLAVFAALMISPIALLGVPDGQDLPQHMRFAAVYHQSILNNDFFPGWAADGNLGFGSIGIRYYPPVPYYLLAFTRILTGNWYDAFWLNAFYWMFLGCVGVYYWAKEWLAPWPAVMAGMLYAIVPYHASQIYQYLLYAEFAAAGILPFCFLYATRIIRHGKRGDVLSFGIAYALLILTHIPLTIIGSVGLGIYVLLLIDWKAPKAAILRFLAAGSLSLAATAFHWLRLTSEMDWVKHNSPQFYANGYYDYSKYFFPIVFSSSENYAAKMLWHFDLTIVFSALLLVPLIVYVGLRLKTRHETAGPDPKILYTLAATGLFAIFIMSAPSAFIWKYVSIFQKTQFPWRWLALASPVGALAFTFGVSLLNARFEALKKPLGYAVGLLLFASCSISMSSLRR